MNPFLLAADVPGLCWLETDLELLAFSPPHRSHPLVVLEALFKGVFEGAGLDGRVVKQLWHCPGLRVQEMDWQAGSRIAVTLQLFGMEAAQIPKWLEQLQARFAPVNRQNFTLSSVSPWRIQHATVAETVRFATDSIDMDFLTPVPLPHVAGRPNTALDDVGFLRLCQTRLRKLFGREAELPPPPQLVTSAWRYWRIEHRSRSQNGNPMFINGCVGRLTLSGPHLAAWLPWLTLFSAVGMGERLSFGQGRFVLTENTAENDAPSSSVPLRLRRPFVLDSDRPGVHLGLDNANLVVSHEHVEEQRIPLMRIASMELHSPCQISTPLLMSCAQQGIPVLLAPPGQPPMVIAGQEAEARRIRGLADHHAGWNSLDEEGRTRLAAGLVDEKLTACAWLVRQRYQPGDNQLLAQIERARSALEHAGNPDRVRGWEGWAARQYHRWLQGHMQGLSDFQRRQHHDSIQDPVNVLLNYSYGLLRNHIACGVRLAGLDPWLGVLHEANGRHEALVSDLMEPWRPYVDRLVLRWIGLRIIQADSFAADDGRLRLVPRARELMVQDFTGMLETAPRGGGPRLVTRIRAMLSSYATAARSGTLANWRVPASSETESMFDEDDEQAQPDIGPAADITGIQTT